MNGENHSPAISFSQIQLQAFSLDRRMRILPKLHEHALAHFAGVLERIEDSKPDDLLMDMIADAHALSLYRGDEVFMVANIQLLRRSQAAQSTPENGEYTPFGRAVARLGIEPERYHKTDANLRLALLKTHYIALLNRS